MERSPSFITNNHVNERTVYEAAARNLGLDYKIEVRNEAYDVNGNPLNGMCALHYHGDRSSNDLARFWEEVRRLRDIRSR